MLFIPFSVLLVFRTEIKHL